MKNKKIVGLKKITNSGQGINTDYFIHIDNSGINVINFSPAGRKNSVEHFQRNFDAYEVILNDHKRSVVVLPADKYMALYE